MAAPALFSSATEEWSTPDLFFDGLDAEFRFELDACATADNAKCEFFYDKETDALRMSWVDDCEAHGLLPHVFMNPPYGRGVTGKWVQKAYEESLKGATVVCLLPARTDTSFWHRYVIDTGAEVRFVKGRLKFGGSKNSAPFPSAVVIFRPPQG